MPPVRTVTDAERRARIGRRHAIAPVSRVAGMAEAAAAMVCLHATEPANVHLSAFARSETTMAALDATLYDERSVVRQLAMRRTVFAFPRDLVPAVRGSAAARTATMQRTRMAKEVAEGGIAADGAAWLAATCDAVLAEIRREPATTLQLRERVPDLDARLEVDPRYSASGSIPIAPRVIGVLAADGAIVRGANAAGWKVSRPYWTAAEQWLPDLPPPTDEAAGYAELVRRWLLTFGPGTEDDVVWWLGSTKTAVRRALAEVGAVEVALEDGTPAYLHPDDLDEVAEPEPWAALLPALDPTTMGWKGRGFHLSHPAEMFDRNGNGGPSAWWCGRVVGGWTQEDDGTVRVVPLPGLPSAAVEPLRVEAERLSAFLDGDVVRTIYQSPLVRLSARA